MKSLVHNEQSIHLKGEGRVYFLKTNYHFFGVGGGINYHLIFSSRTVGPSLLGLGYI